MLDEGDGDSAGVFTAKKSTLSRLAISKNATLKSTNNLSIPLRRDEDGRPSYSADYLNELKSSTPSAPQDLSLSTINIEAEGGRTLDLASKFGTDLALRTEDGIIPTAAEIAEKKARRKRLAQENEYISLHHDTKHPNSSSNSNSDSEEKDEDGLRLPKPKYAETRLVPDDEDIAEGFDDFVTDAGRITLTRAAETAQRRARKAEIANLIAEAEGSASDPDAVSRSDDSEVERRTAYEVAQTRKGMDGLHHNAEDEEKERRPRTPPRVTPLPTLGGVLERLRDRVLLLQKLKMRRVGVLEEYRLEKEGIGEAEGRVQRGLQERGREFERLSAEAGIVVDGSGGTLIGGGEAAGDGDSMGRERGLESLGGTPVGVETGSP